jgi:hypothetical protein
MSKVTKKRSTLPKTPRGDDAKRASEVVKRGRPDTGDAFLRDPTEALPRMHSGDSLAEMLGEEFVQAATSGQEASSADVDGVSEEEEFGGSRAIFAVGASAAPATKKASTVTKRAIQDKGRPKPKTNGASRPH